MNLAMPAAKDKALFLRISQEDKELLQRAAERAEMKLSDWIRKIAKAAARKTEREGPARVAKR